MNVTISVGGRFHAFYLADQLHKRGHLRRLITSYPKFETVKYGIPRSNIKSILSHEILSRSFWKAPLWLQGCYNPQFFLSDRFDRLAARHIPKDTNIFVGWSSMALHSLRQAKRHGAITVVERGSTHILYQTQILQEEYEKHSLPVRVAHPRIVEKELEEYEEADFISVPSLYVKRTFLQRSILESKLIHVPYGVDLSGFRPVPKEDDVFRLICSGGISLRKGVNYLLQAFHDLNLPNTELWLVGSINDEIRPFLGRYRNGKVVIKGHQPQSRLHWFYSQGSVFCLASVEEGLAMVIPQAMACGLPVICTTNTGGEDIARNGQDGFIVPIKDVDAIKEKILYLYEHPQEREAMGQSARQRVEKGFSWDDYGNRITEKYSRIGVDQEVRP
jgi:glycosyltransferase involved in cell wall biosynthesis